MTSENTVTEETKNGIPKPKWGLIISTVLQIYLFPSFYAMGQISYMIFDGNPHPFVAWFFIYAMQLIPFSIPISLTVMWGKYFRQKYRNIRIFYFLPFLMLVAISFFVEFLLVLFKKR